MAWSCQSAPDCVRPAQHHGKSTVTSCSRAASDTRKIHPRTSTNTTAHEKPAFCGRFGIPEALQKDFSHWSGENVRLVLMGHGPSILDVPVVSMNFRISGGAVQ
eukprot:4395277-Prymnesium_polylepis.2